MMNTMQLPQQKDSSSSQPQTPGRVQYSLPAICTSEQTFPQRGNFAPPPRQNNFMLIGSEQELYRDQNFLDPESDMFDGTDEVNFELLQEQNGFPFEISSNNSNIPAATESSVSGGTYGYMLTNPMSSEGMASAEPANNALLDIQMNRFEDMSLEDTNTGMLGSSGQVPQFPTVQGKDGKSYAIETWKQYFGEVSHCTWNDFKRFVMEKSPVDKDVLDKLKELFCYKGLKDVVDCTRWAMFVLLFHSEYFDNDPRPTLAFNEALDLLNKYIYSHFSHIFSIQFNSYSIQLEGSMDLRKGLKQTGFFASRTIPRAASSGPPSRRAGFLCSRGRGLGT